jgi:hypothetical protein
MRQSETANPDPLRAKSYVLNIQRDGIRKKYADIIHGERKTDRENFVAGAIALYMQASTMCAIMRASFSGPNSNISADILNKLFDETLEYGRLLYGNSVELKDVTIVISKLITIDPRLFIDTLPKGQRFGPPYEAAKLMIERRAKMIKK